MTSSPPNQRYPEGQKQDQFHVYDERTANWLVRKVVQARQYRERVKQWAEQEVKRAARKEKNLLFLYGAQLEMWAGSEIARQRGKRSINLPAGRVGYRKSRLKVVIEDENAAKRWAKAACPEAIIITEHLCKSALMASIQATGELPPEGLRFELGRDTFIIC